MSLTEWKTEASPSTQTVEVCFDRTLVSELEEAQARLQAAKKTAGGMLEAPAELENHVAELAKKVEEKTRTFIFSSIGRRAWRKLLSEHPPTDEQKENTPPDVFGNRIDNNPETFPVAAMVATCTSPGLTQEEAQWIADELPEAVYMRFWNAVLQANVLGGDEKKAVATAAAPVSDER